MATERNCTSMIKIYSIFSFVRLKWRTRSVQGLNAIPSLHSKPHDISQYGLSGNTISHMEKWSK